MNCEYENYEDCTKKPVLVTGANGFMGSQITRQLVAAQRDVRVLVRENSNTESIDGLPVERYLGDVMNIESLKTAMRGCGTVFYSVVDTRAWLSDPAPLYKCNVEGLRNALESARLEGVERFVFTSSIATLGRKKDGSASESDPFNWWDVAPHYIKSRVEAENLLLEYCRDKCLPGIALCVANTYGPEDYQPTPQGGLLWQAATGKLPLALECSAPTVDIRDAAQAALLAERYGHTGERYIVANEYIRQPALYALAAACLERKPPRTLSIRFAYVMATISEWIAKLSSRKDLKLCRDSIFLSEVFGPLDNSRIVNEFGWKPRPIGETVEDAIAWFSARRRKSTVSKTGA